MNESRTEPFITGPAGSGKTSAREMIIAHRAALIEDNSRRIGVLGLAAARQFDAARAIPWWKIFAFNRAMKVVEYLLWQLSELQDQNDLLAVQNKLAMHEADYR